MEYYRAGNKALKYILSFYIPLCVIVEGGLAFCAYLTKLVPAFMVFLVVLISLVMAAALYYCIIRAIFITKTFKVRLENSYIEVYYRCIGEYRSITPLRGKTTFEVKKAKFSKSLFILKIINGGHTITLRYIDNETVEKITGVTNENNKTK